MGGFLRFPFKATPKRGKDTQTGLRLVGYYRGSPALKVWLLSLCRDLLCSDLIATVPVAGFKFGDAPMVQVASRFVSLINSSVLSIISGNEPLPRK